jgi:hypothetical protein
MRRIPTGSANRGGSGRGNGWHEYINSIHAAGFYHAVYPCTVDADRAVYPIHSSCAIDATGFCSSCATRSIQASCATCQTSCATCQTSSAAG